MEYNITDWDSISIQFSKMFENLGDINLTEEYISYSPVLVK